MKSGQALGIIEVNGLCRLIVAVDAALKAANVTVLSSHKLGKGLVTATLNGDVGSVQAALSAAEATVLNEGASISVHLIPRPDPTVGAMLIGGVADKNSPTQENSSSAPVPPSGPDSSAKAPERAATVDLTSEEPTLAEETADKQSLVPEDSLTKNSLPEGGLESKIETVKNQVASESQASEFVNPPPVKATSAKPADKKSGTKKNSGKPRKPGGKK